MNHHKTIEIVEQEDAAVGTDTDGPTEKEQFETTGIRPSVPRDPPRDDTADRCSDQLERLLQEVPRGFPAEPETSPCTIFRIPQLLRGIDSKAEEPEIVSIGPYYRGRPQVLEFERLKPLFLKRFLRRCNRSNLRVLTESAASLEPSARLCYSERVDLTRHDFLQMMLLDGCFVVEFLLHPLFKSGDAADEPGPIFESGDVTDEPDPIVAQPQMIPILIRDLLKLENQIPYSVLECLFDKMVFSNPKGKTGSLTLLALKLFNHAYPRPMAVIKFRGERKCEHLLDLFYRSLSPTRRVHPNSPKESWSSAQSVPLVTELRPSGVKFKSKKSDSLLDINFHKPMPWNPFIPIKDFMTSSLMNLVIQMPNIPINDFMTTVLINCVSLDQCRENRAKYMSDYVSFMHCLINQPKDVSLLRSDGIITLYSRDDQYVADLFNKLGKSISFNMMRTYFSSPWSVISLFSAFLIVVLSITQTIVAILTYRSHR
ncbi:hypothetical protein EUGRSUZ_L01006 [Eucalyptus grandis]|uniref:Uncharacterized protein n=1 Tax=Eucalyptus grandis TaxID=71139 RepID=A0A058ZU53_EUCGR|nr:hypothetical protein EUGRSUZ_L01006 [Eucalyptus grandis]